MNLLLQKAPSRVNKIGLESFLPWVWLVCAYCITLGVLIVRGEGYIDSDMSSEMVLADLMNQEGDWFLSKGWGYSTEIRVFYLQLIYRITLLIFPHNWFAARMLGQAVWLLLLVLCMLYAGHTLGLRGCGVWAAAALICPFGTDHFWFCLFSGSYIPHIILTLLSFALAIQFMQSFGKKLSIRLALLFLLALVSFINGLGSLKGLMAVYLPMLMAASLALAFSLHSGPGPVSVRSAEFRFLIGAVVSAASAAAGYLVNSVVLAARYDFMNQNGLTWNKLDLNAFLDSIAGFLSLFGFPHGNVMSLYSVLGAFSFIIVAAVLISLVFLIRNYQSLPFGTQLLLVTFLCSVILQASIFSFTENSLGYVLSYWWLTTIPMVFLLLQSAWQQFSFRLPSGRLLCAAAFMLCMVFVSIASTHTYFTSGSFRAVPEMKPAEEWLLENGYREGYALFWKANVLTEWSSGQLDVRVVDGYHLDVTEPHSWLEKHSHQTPPKGKVFLLVTASELWGAHKESIRSDYNVYWDENDYLIMAFDSYDEMVTALQNAHEG